MVLNVAVYGVILRCCLGVLFCQYVSAASHKKAGVSVNGAEDITEIIDGSDDLTSRVSEPVSKATSDILTRSENPTEDTVLLSSSTPADVTSHETDTIDYEELSARGQTVENTNVPVGSFAKDKGDSVTSDGFPVITVLGRSASDENDLTARSDIPGKHDKEVGRSVASDSVDLSNDTPNDLVARIDTLEFLDGKRDDEVDSTSTNTETDLVARAYVNQGNVIFQTASGSKKSHVIEPQEQATQGDAFNVLETLTGNLTATLLDEPAISEDMIDLLANEQFLTDTSNVLASDCSIDFLRCYMKNNTLQRSFMMIFTNKAFQKLIRDILSDEELMKRLVDKITSIINRS